jgi:type I restriction enzyme S subunit
MFYTEIGPDLDARYFYYFATQINFGFYSTNTALPSMASSDLRAIRLSMPPMSEQLQIASYLDRETGQIDALITKQEQLVATLTERRQTVITQAVTRGLDPEVKLKGSGSEWWDRIPVTWTVRRIKHVVETPITDGPHTTPEFLDEGVEFISAEAISAGVVNFDKRRGFISRTDNLSYSAKYSPKLHDIYMIKSGATTGVSAILTEMREFNIWSPLAVIRANSSVDPFFLHYAIRSAPFQRAVSQTWTYGTQQNIGMKSIGELAVPSPTLPEQKAIVAFLDASTLHADRLVQLAKDSIALLRERRQALISAAVTGKIDVRGL